MKLFFYVVLKTNGTVTVKQYLDSLISKLMTQNLFLSQVDISEERFIGPWKTINLEKAKDIAKYPSGCKGAVTCTSTLVPRLPQRLNDI